MGHEFELSDDVRLAATPEQVWAAIATGPGLDSWFLGHNAAGSDLGQQVASDFADGAIPAGSITGWAPGQRLATSSAVSPDGRFLAREQLITARGDGSCVLRIITSGFLPGDDWAEEFEAMRAGECAFRSSLAEYLAHFAGRQATPLTLFGPAVSDWAATWRRFDAAAGITEPVRGQPVRLALPAGPAVTGMLYAAHEQVRCIRTPDTLLRFIQGLGGGMVLCHVRFGPGDRQPAEAHRAEPTTKRSTEPAWTTAWQDWLTEFSG